MRGKILSIVLLIVLPMTLTGCWDYQDINKRDITLSIGLDKVDGNYEFSGEIARLMPSSGESKGAPGTDVIPYRSIGANIEDARKDYDTKTTLPDFSGATRVVALSERYARENIEPYINRVNNLSDFRKSLLFVINKGPTYELFKDKIKNDTSVSYGIENIIRYHTAQGACIYTTAQDIQAYIQFKQIGYFIPCVEREKDEIKYCGLAAFKESKLIEIIPSKDCSGFLALIGKKYISTITLPDPDKPENTASLKVILKARKISTSYVDNKIIIRADIKADCEFQYEYEAAPINKDKLIKLEEAVAKDLKDKITSAVEHSQKELKCDVCGFGRYFKADNYAAYKKINWKEEYPKAKFEANVIVRMKDSNLIEPDSEKSY